MSSPRTLRARYRLARLRHGRAHAVWITLLASLGRDWPPYPGRRR